MSSLALYGGPRTKTTPFGSGKRFGEEEKKQLMQVIDEDMLFYFFGKKVFELQETFARLYGMNYCIACSSGTAAVHIAIGTLELTPGTEVITSAITDMGTLTGILYQNLIPVFADIDPLTYNLTAESIEQRITPRTGAIVVVHHAGLAADMDKIMALGEKYHLPIIEDCAQAYLCGYQGRWVGTMGAINAFSLNHFKHITCGSGGMVLTNDEKKRKIASLFVDKCYDREAGKRNPYFLAPNYQMTELQGAVALAQLKKLEWIVERRNRLGTQLTEYLQQIPGITPPSVPAGCRHSYFLFMFRVDLSRIRVSLVDFSKALAAEGIPNAPHMITGGMCEYQYDIFRNLSAFPNSRHPFVSSDLGTNISYQEGLCPQAEKAFLETINLQINEFYTEKDIREMADAVEKVAGFYRSEG
ncbi:MAG TPA: DegT/DnrJ/EryC1/StrS family aminotransferase [bacterium]|mgnify:CR=1 FL=1|nr:DegT/DnrJ/EryC1/StrS family aminotransferase [bacterium]